MYLCVGILANGLSIDLLCAVQEQSAAPVVRQYEVEILAPCTTNSCAAADTAYTSKIYSVVAQLPNKGCDGAGRMREPYWCARVR